MELKKITAIVRSDQLEEIEERFKGPDLPGITVDHVRGYGEYANFFAKDWMSRYARVEIVADERQARQIVDAIAEVVHTGSRGDGIVYVVPVEQLHRIRDRHTARSAQTCPRCRASTRLRRRARTTSLSRTRKKPAVRETRVK
jgi:nitrogen regulatory protein P-II 1